MAGIDLRRDNRRLLRQRVGWLGHQGSFYDDLTVGENLRFAAKAAGRPVTDIAPALDRVDLAHRHDVVTAALSAGQRRRLALAWLLVRRPELWLLDEPHAALDPDGRRLLDEIVSDVVAAGGTVVVSAHYEGDLNNRGTSVTLAGGRVLS